MTTYTHSNAESFGRRLGRTWVAVLRYESRAMRWAVHNGMSPIVAKSVLWLLKLALIGVVLYVAFWVALVLILLFAALNSAPRVRREDKGEWRNGLEGYGYYEGGVRTDSNRLFESD